VHGKNGRTLLTLPRSGRPTKLSGKKLITVKKAIGDEIVHANEKYGSINTKQIAEIIRGEIGKQYTLRHVERIMHKLGFSLITPRPQHLRHDQKKVDNFRDEFKKNLKKRTWITSS
jgi:transposase